MQGILSDRWVPEDLWMEVSDIVQEAVKTIYMKKKCKMVKLWGLTKNLEKERR